MGLFDSLTNLGKAAIDTALLPVDMAADVVDGTNGKLGRSNTERRLERIGDDITEAYEETKS